MKTVFSKNRLKLFFIAVSVAVFSASCEKENVLATTESSSAKGKTEGIYLEIAYLYTKDIYLWNNMVPDIEEFHIDYDKDIYHLMEKVRSYQPLDRFSFVEKQTETEETEEGRKTDLGFLVKFFTGEEDLRVNYVYARSAAGKAGVKRGWKVLAINGNTIDGNNEADINLLNRTFFGDTPTAEFTFEKPGGDEVKMTLPVQSYQINTVLYKDLIKCGNKTAGYFVYNEFSGRNSVEELVKTIRFFEEGGVDELIIDLRYNRGGLVSTQDTLANMIAPKKVGSGRNLMYEYVFNANYSSLNEDVYFCKAGNLNLKRVFFIVSPQSASASEMLINNLKPVMDVVLIGEEHTFGKPVGFFPLPVGPYNIFPVSFKTVNSSGYGEYFKGIPVNRNTIDDLEHEFGDTSETCLKEALSYIDGSAALQAQRRVQPAAAQNVKQMNEKISGNIHKVAIENRPYKMPEPVMEMIRENRVIN